VTVLATAAAVEIVPAMAGTVTVLATAAAAEIVPAMAETVTVPGTAVAAVEIVPATAETVTGLATAVAGETEKDVPPTEAVIVKADRIDGQKAIRGQTAPTTLDVGTFRRLTASSRVGSSPDSRAASLVDSRAALLREPSSRRLALQIGPSERSRAS
jgi:hypothetical protein